MELFSGRLKGYLEEGLAAGPLPADDPGDFRAEGLPLDLAYVPLIESAFKPSAVSRAKAQGMWQFMRGTALENGSGTTGTSTSAPIRRRPRAAAAKYLKHVARDVRRLAPGPRVLQRRAGRVQRAMKRSGRDDFWKLSASRRYLPRETRDYVPLILAAVIVARNPAQYGLTVSPSPRRPPSRDRREPDRLAPRGRVDRRALETLQDLNPELRRWTTPVRDDQYPLRVPFGAAEMVRTRAAELAVELPDPFTRQTVKKGETLASVAKKLRVTRTDLAEANYLSVRAPLSAGQELIIPRGAGVNRRPPTRCWPPAPARSHPTSSSRPRRHPSAPRSPERRVHRVKAGETLTSIARLYRTTVASIREWNNLRGTTIRIGQRLTIRGAGDQAD